MCGIAGIINFRNGAENQIGQMLLQLGRRGPDHQAIWSDRRVILGHTRLSILDVTNAANQPMRYLDNVITYNGEVYNFQELKKDLQLAGYRFETGSDTEVLLKGYHYWGLQNMLQKLEGMFAFCLYDQKKSIVYLCRDRFGKKPLYVSRRGMSIYFASEISALRQIGLGKEIDLQALDYYLTELAVPQPRSIFSKIEQIPPATCRTLPLKDLDTYFDKRYYIPQVNRGASIPEEELLLQLEGQLSKAILQRTIADVPIGAFLSGGVDSGLIVALLAERSSHPVKTFSVGFDEESHNELPLAKIVAEKYRTEHTEIRLLSSDLPNILEATLAYVAEPFADPSILPTAMVSKAISKSVKVALSGDGGDEVFGGYGEFLTAYNADVFLEKYSPFARQIKVFQNKLNNKLHLRNTQASLYNSYLNMNAAGRLNRYQGFDLSMKHRLYSSESSQALGWGETYMNQLWNKVNPNVKLMDHLFLTMLPTRLLNNYLVKVDRASMMHSLEVRSPFLDHNLLDFAFHIEASQLSNGGKTTKYLLKKLVQKKYDPEIMTRQKKGFEIPLAAWLKADLKEMVCDLLNADAVKRRGFFKPTEVQRYLSEHLSEKKDHSYRIWSLLCLELWMRGQNDIKYE